MLKTIANHLIPVQVIKLCVILNDAGYQAFLVGGCIRDMLLGDKPKDYDIATDASPEKIMTIFPKHIATGLKHGTITVCLDKENHFEVTTFRVEGIYLDGRRPEEVKFVKKVEEDLARRDFTINAVAYDPISYTLVDPFGGLQDLNDKIIRAVGDANARFQEDGLRIMRAARFAARFGYQIEENTFTGMKANLDTLKKVSKERISDELRKILMSKYNSHGMFLLLETNALRIVCQLLNNTSVTALKKLDKCVGELETRLALIYSSVSIKSTQEELMSLKFSNKEIQRVVFLLEVLHFFEQTNYKKFIAHFKNQAPDAWEHTLSQFIGLTSALGATIQGWLDQHQNVVVWARKELSIDGNDLMAEGVKPGPNMKILLDSCYSEVLEHPEHNNKEYLLQFCLAI